MQYENSLCKETEKKNISNRNKNKKQIKKLQ